MTTDNFPDDSELITQVAGAFERMQVPPGPSVQQTIDLIDRAASKDDLLMVVPYAQEKSPGRTWTTFALRLRRLTVKQRIAAGGVGVSMVLGFVLVFLAVNSPARLSAMERMAHQLREIKSYSYRDSWESTWTEDDGKLTVTSKGDGPTYWKAPDAFHTEMKIVRIERKQGEAKGSEQLREHFAEIYPANRRGIFIDYTTKTFTCLAFNPIGSSTYPHDLVRMIQEGSGEVTRELGTKEIRGKKARGYTIILKGSHEKQASNQPKDPVEVWVDPATDLPLEFGYEGKNESTYSHRITEFRWNVELDPKLFMPTPPEGFADITPPDGEKELAQIAEALKLYAQLSGGHYPRVRRFDSRAVHDEMLKLAGFDPESKPEWDKDSKYQSIQQATAGLDWIARIIRNRYHASYDGKNVGPADKDKLLMWWRVSSPERYCLIYGDLRTEVIPQANGAKLGLDESFPDMTKDDPPPNE